MSIFGSLARGTGKVIKWTILGCAGLIVVAIVVSLVALGNAADKSEESSRQVKPAQFRALAIGTPKAQVRKLFGKPEDTSVTESAGFSMECWHYGVLAQSGMYQFCFGKAGRLETKARY